MASELRLPALALPGLSPDSLGNYLASVGLLRVLSRKWPSTRIAWRDEVLRVVGGPPTLDALLDELVRVASEREWAPYDKGWSDAQKKGTKAGSGKSLLLWQAQAAEQHLELFAAHAVPHARVSFNPLLGSGGNAGRRDFAAGWTQAVDALASEPAKPTTRKGTAAALESGVASRTIKRRSELEALFAGHPLIWLLEKLAAGCWFSDATKLYNSGQSPSREGQISPWAMALACEGLALLAGGVSRRLGARSRAVGAFPFVTSAIAPQSEGEAGRILGEVWTPLWNRPMTLAEARTLFSRGRAELHGRGALTPAAFATAIRQRGMDGGVSEFRRFTLGRTTSANTFEPRFEGRFARDGSAHAMSDATSIVLERVTALIEQHGFPRDGKRFAGLRGPIESALLRVAADPERSDASITLLDAIVAGLDRIDRNRGFREGGIRWRPLPIEWLPSLFADQSPGAEARLALSLVSAFPHALPFAAFRFGVEWTRRRSGKCDYNWNTAPTWFEHSRVAPSRWVWGSGDLARVLGAVLSRRLLEESKLDATETTRPQGRAPLPAKTADVSRWFAGDVDESLLTAWLSRLALFDWRRLTPEVDAPIRGDDTAPRMDGELALQGLIQPLVDRRPLVVRYLSPGDLLSDETGARTVAAARSLVALVRAGNLDSAIRVARGRYSMAGATLASSDAPWSTRAPERLLAGLLFTISDGDRAVLFQRWLRPRRRQAGDEADV